ncbi:Cobinamide/cobalamin adenosyltransferase [Hyphomicrobium sp. 1Nfss2.1]
MRRAVVEKRRLRCPIPPWIAQDAEVAGKTIEKGLIIVHTGKGRGKPTAAFGLLLGALGRGFKTGVVQFGKGAWGTGERHAIDRFPGQVEWYALGHMGDAGSRAGVKAQEGIEF